MSVTNESKLGLTEKDLNAARCAERKSHREQVMSDVRGQFAINIANHTVKAIKCDGLHRHYLCRNPKSGSYWFEVVTWPGVLCISGDIGDYVFRRTDDMLEFMKSAASSISYAAEKCIAAGREGIKKFSEELLAEVLDEHLSEHPEDSETIDEIRQEFRMYGSEHDALRAMFESDLWGSELPTLETYTHHFLWCLEAIKWLCVKLESKDYNP